MADDDFKPGDKVQAGTSPAVYTVDKAPDKYGRVWVITPSGRRIRLYLDRDCVVPDQTGH
jgi:hypothetical protein